MRKTVSAILTLALCTALLTCCTEPSRPAEGQTPSPNTTTVTALPSPTFEGTPTETPASTPTPTETPTPSPEPPHTSAPSITVTPTPTEIPTPTVTPTPTLTETPSPTPTPTVTPTSALTETPSPTPAETVLLSGKETSNTGTSLNVIFYWTLAQKPDGGYLVRVSARLEYYSLFCGKRTSENCVVIGDETYPYRTDPINVSLDGRIHDTLLCEVVREYAQDELPAELELSACWLFNGVYSKKQIGLIRAFTLLDLSAFSAQPAPSPETSLTGTEELPEPFPPDEPI